MKAYIKAALKRRLRPPIFHCLNGFPRVRFHEIHPHTRAIGQTTTIVQVHTAASVRTGIAINIMQKPQTLWRNINRSREASICFSNRETRLRNVIISLPSSRHYHSVRKLKPGKRLQG